jgi:hypothetical protein
MSSRSIRHETGTQEKAQHAVLETADEAYVAHVRQTALEIFKAEFEARKPLVFHKERTVEKYVRLVEDIVADVRTSKVNIDDEQALFTTLSDALYKKQGAKRLPEILLSTSIDHNTFNCYSSTMLFVDVLAQLGKPVNIIIMPKHVLIVGEQFFFETTKLTRPVAFSREEFDAHYPRKEWHETSAEKLLSGAHQSIGYFLFKHKQDPDKALYAYRAAGDIDSKNIGALNGEGILLDYRKNYWGAIQAYDHALKICPEYVEVLKNKGMALRALGNEERDKAVGNKYLREAIAVYEKALAIRPITDKEKASLLYYEGKVFESLDMPAEAKACVKASNALGGADKTEENGDDGFD